MKYEVEIIRSNRKTLYIEVTADLRVIAKVPLRMPQNEIKRIVQSRADWISKEIRRIKLLRNEHPNLQNKLSEDELAELRERTKRIVSERVAYYAPIIDVKYNRITIKIQHKRWGSCSGKRNLNFNILLGLCPLEVINYVVVHELCHLIEFNHSQQFWNLVEGILPDYRERRRWLNDNATILLWQIS